MFSATLPLDKEQLITEGPAITVGLHVKYAMRAIINDSKEVAEITGVVHATKEACVKAFEDKIKYGKFR